ncbi:uncharacterized protein LOC119598133 [Penaeus monodon]|uniref:uncharacterized protein LOC119598133 n=1 Tax=Penaeus monodon TaxID=6687 RepID=UPI0018A6E7FF|nr:uncharacterized protein LOC119598133 [Penaeus monodon]
MSFPLSTYSRAQRRRVSSFQEWAVPRCDASIAYVRLSPRVSVAVQRRLEVDLDRSYSALLSTLHRGDHEATEDAIADVVLLTHLHEWMETGSVEPRAPASQLTRSSPGSRRD